MRRINAKTFARLEELQGYAQELADLLYDIHDNAEEYHSERSERWLESDAGAAQELVDQAKDEYPDERIVDVYAEHVYPLKYQKRNTGPRDNTIPSG